ncbi:hypothetical protein [Sorangium cellulosum]|nr:hypothetical protein [Sorangium cellulosum]
MDPPLQDRSGIRKMWLRGAAGTPALEPVSDGSTPVPASEPSPEMT